MFTPKLRRLSYVWLLVQGLATALAPKTSVQLNARLWGCPFENPGDLEPKEWYVRTVRAAGVGMLAAGGVGLLLEDRAEKRDAAVDDATADDGPVSLDVDDDPDESA